jgi:hypothetical protein
MRKLVVIFAFTVAAAGCSTTDAGLTQQTDGTYVLRAASIEEASRLADVICAKTGERAILMAGLTGPRFPDIYCWRCFGPDAGWTYWRDCP